MPFVIFIFTTSLRCYCFPTKFRWKCCFNRSYYELTKYTILFLVSSFIKFCKLWKIFLLSCL